MRAVEKGWLLMHESGIFCTLHASQRGSLRVMMRRPNKRLQIRLEEFDPKSKARIGENRS
jgi:hypothetical protein